MAKAITLQQNYIDKLGDQALDLIQSDVALLLLRVIVLPALISTLQFVWWSVNYIIAPSVQTPLYTPGSKYRLAPIYAMGGLRELALA